MEKNLGFLGGSVVKNPPATADVSSVPVSGRSPGEGSSNTPQYSCLEHSVDRGAWWATVHGVAKESEMTQKLNNSNTYVCVCAYRSPSASLHHHLPPWLTVRSPVLLPASPPWGAAPEIILFVCNVYLLTAILPSLDCKSLGQDVSILFTACSQSLEQW